MSTIAVEKKDTLAEKAAGSRASVLADRIEGGARLLAGFVNEISDEEWITPVSATDKRTVGTIVHHVGSMYPIEIEAAKAIAGGNPVTDVTWEAVAELNAGHGAEFATVTKNEALEILRRNSNEAAAAVREFSDDELDRAAPFSLSFGAPMTAQFVIEDHALRHAWHHLAKIRKGLGR